MIHKHKERLKGEFDALDSTSSSRISPDQLDANITQLIEKLERQQAEVTDAVVRWVPNTQALSQQRTAGATS